VSSGCWVLGEDRRFRNEGSLERTPQDQCENRTGCTRGERALIFFAGSNASSSQSRPDNQDTHDPHETQELTEYYSSWLNTRSLPRRVATLQRPSQDTKGVLLNTEETRMNWRQDPPDYSNSTVKLKANAAPQRDVVLEALSRFWLLILVTGLFLAAATFGVSTLQSKVYSSQVQVQLVTDPYASVGSSRSIDESRNSRTEGRVANGQVVRKLASDRVKASMDVSVVVEPDTSILNFRAQASTPEIAQKHATEYANTYLEYSKSRSKANLEKSLKVVDREISDTNAALATTGLTEQSKTELGNTLDQFRDQRTRLSSALRLDADLGVIFSEAELPTTPDSPKPLQASVLGGLLGLLAGVGLATVLVIRSPQRLDLRNMSQFRSIPVLSTPGRLSGRAVQQLADEVATDIDSATARGLGVGALFILLADPKQAKSLLERTVDRLGKLRGAVARLDIEPTTNIEGVCGQTESQRRANRNVAIVLPVEGVRTAASLATVTSSVFVVFSARGTTERVLERRLLQLQSNGFTIDGLIAV
jgi:capsular polysaccharide biosynthesis protein